MRLVFVYNANSGKVNALLDSLHKITNPLTYNCNLCALTFGNFSENMIWKKFRENSEIEMVFLHKDEFLNQYESEIDQNHDFPLILIEKDSKFELILSAEELNRIRSVESLIDAIKKRQPDC